MGGWRRGLTAAVLVVASILRLPSAAAQVATDGAGTLSSLPAAGQAATGGASTLPSLPQGGFGVPSVTVSPASQGLAPPATPIGAPSLQLPAPGAGIITLQQSNPEAPLTLIVPQVTVAQALFDNAQQSGGATGFSAETQLMPGLNISTDTPRLQGVLNGQFEYDKYEFSKTQDQLFGNMFARGTATALPEHLFVDLYSTASVANRFGGVGFAPTTQQSSSNLTQVLTNSVSPYFRESYGGLIDSEIRYRFSSTDFIGNTGVVTPSPTPLFPITPSTTALSNSISNEGTVTVGTGSDFERLLSKLTLDASQLETTGVTANSESYAYDDFEYRITPTFAVLSRLGYENIHYLQAPLATTSGVLWQVGGRVELGPENQYAELRYGQQAGIYGFTGSVRYALTPATTVTVSATQGLNSTQSAIESNVIGSNLDQYGQIVDQFGTPTAFVNPEFSLENNVFREREYQIGVQTVLEVNRFFLFAFQDRQTSLISTTASSNSFGANFNWTRNIRPTLTGSLALGYSRVSNLSLVSATPAPALNSPGSTATAQLGLTYLLSPSLIGSVTYYLTYTTGSASTAVSGTATNGNIVAHELRFSLTKTF
jgi:uncharacterized protein (PEP-CTERM system associated)